MNSAPTTTGRHSFDAPDFAAVFDQIPVMGQFDFLVTKKPMMPPTTAPAIPAPIKVPIQIPGRSVCHPSACMCGITVYAPTAKNPTLAPKIDVMTGV
jgi:hypothetical protein